MQENSSFISFENNTSGLIFDDSSHPRFPIRYYNLINGEGLEAKENCSYFFYVYEGSLEILNPEWTFFKQGVSEFCYATANNIAGINGSGKSIAIEVSNETGSYRESNYKSYNMVGGPIEENGRLKYIDGCTDSLLISPVKLGDPCLNHLHFPEHISQTQHTHPSHRIGIVTKGSGKCITPFGNLPLTEGMIFVIKEWDGLTFAEGLDGEDHPVGQHSFDTYDQSMDVIAFHPDSDFGPEDECHPMINRTIVDGISANILKEIQTK